METITITKRVVNGSEVYNKRFDNYDAGFYGMRISKNEYIESKMNNEVRYAYNEPALNIVKVDSAKTIKMIEDFIEIIENSILG